MKCKYVRQIPSSQNWVNISKKETIQNKLYFMVFFVKLSRNEEAENLLQACILFLY
jgi:hypothetical protein